MSGASKDDSMTAKSQELVQAGDSRSLPSQSVQSLGTPQMGETSQAVKPETFSDCEVTGETIPGTITAPVIVLSSENVSETEDDVVTSEPPKGNVAAIKPSGEAPQTEDGSLRAAVQRSVQADRLPSAPDNAQAVGLVAITPSDGVKVEQPAPVAESSVEAEVSAPKPVSEGDVAAHVLPDSAVGDSLTDLGFDLDKLRVGDPSMEVDTSGVIGSVQLAGTPGTPESTKVKQLVQHFTALTSPQMVEVKKEPLSGTSTPPPTLNLAAAIQGGGGEVSGDGSSVEPRRQVDPSGIGQALGARRRRDLKKAFKSGKYYLPDPPPEKQVYNRDIGARMLLYASRASPCGATYQRPYNARPGEANILYADSGIPGFGSKLTSEHKNGKYRYWDVSYLYCYKGQSVMCEIPDGRSYKFHTLDGPFPSTPEFIEEVEYALKHEPWTEIVIDSPAKYPNIDLYEIEEICTEEIPKDEREPLPSPIVREVNRDASPIKVHIPCMFNKYHTDMSEFELDNRNFPNGRAEPDPRCVRNFLSKDLKHARARRRQAEAEGESPGLGEGMIAAMAAANDSDIDVDSNGDLNVPDDDTILGNESGTDSATEPTRYTQKGQLMFSVSAETAEECKQRAQNMVVEWQRQRQLAKAAASKGAATTGAESPMEVDMEPPASTSQATPKTNPKPKPAAGGVAAKVSPGTPRRNKPGRKPKPWRAILPQKPPKEVLERKFSLAEDRMCDEDMNETQWNEYIDAYYNMLIAECCNIDDLTHLWGNEGESFWASRTLTTCHVFHVGMKCPVPGCKVPNRVFTTRLEYFAHWRAIHIVTGAAFVKCKNCSYRCHKPYDLRKHLHGCWAEDDRLNGRDWKMTRTEIASNPPKEFIDLIKDRTVHYWFPVVHKDSCVRPEYAERAPGGGGVRSHELYYWIWLHPENKDPRLPLAVGKLNACPRPGTVDWNTCHQRGFKNYGDMLKAGIQPSSLAPGDMRDLDKIKRLNVPCDRVEFGKGKKGKGKRKSSTERLPKETPKKRQKARTSSSGTENQATKRGDNGGDSDTAGGADQGAAGGGQEISDVESDKGNGGGAPWSSAKAGRRGSRGRNRKRSLSNSRGASPDSNVKKRAQSSERLGTYRSYPYRGNGQAFIDFIERMAAIERLSPLDYAYKLYLMLEVGIWYHFHHLEANPTLPKDKKNRIYGSIIGFRQDRAAIRLTYHLFDSEKAKAKPDSKVTIAQVLDSLSRAELKDDPIVQLDAYKEYSMDNLNWEIFPFEIECQPKLCKSFPEKDKRAFLRWNNTSCKKRKAEKAKLAAASKATQEAEGDSDSDEDSSSVLKTQRVTRSQTVKTRESPASSSEYRVMEDKTFSDATVGAKHPKTVVPNVQIQHGELPADQSIWGGPDIPSPEVQVVLEDVGVKSPRQVSKSQATPVPAPRRGKGGKASGKTDHKDKEFDAELGAALHSMSEAATADAAEAGGDSTDPLRVFSLNLIRQIAFAGHTESMRYGRHLATDARRDGIPATDTLREYATNLVHHVINSTLTMLHAYDTAFNLDYEDDRMTAQEALTLKAEIDHFKKVYIDLDAEKDQIKEECDKANADNDALKKQVQDLQAALDKKKEEERNLQTAYNLMQIDYNKTVKELSDLRSTGQSMETTTVASMATTSGGASATSNPVAQDTRFQGEPENWDEATKRELFAELECVSLTDPVNYGPVADTIQNVPAEIPLWYPDGYKWIKTGISSRQYKIFLQELQTCRAVWAQRFGIDPQ